MSVIHRVCSYVLEVGRLGRDDFMRLIFYDFFYLIVSLIAIWARLALFSLFTNRSMINPVKKVALLLLD